MKLVQLAQSVGGRVSAAASGAEITGVAAIAAAGPSDVVFVEDAAMLASALASAAGAVIVSEKLAASVEGRGKPLIIAAQPKLAFARAAQVLRPPQPPQGIHPAAVISPDATLGLGITIAAHAVVESGAHIGDNTCIGAGAIIARGVRIGSDCAIHPRVVIYTSTVLGDRVIVHAGAVLGSDGFGYVRDSSSGQYLQFPQQGRLVIEDDVEIGANTTIDRGALEETRICRGVKIDNLVHIAHNVRVEHDVVIAALTGVSGSCLIGANAIVGGQVGLGDHVEIGEGVILGSGSGVLTHKKLKGAGVIHWGRPARPLAQYLKELATLARLAAAKKPSRKQEG